MGGLGVRAAPAIVGQVRRAEKNEKAGRAAKGGTSGTGETSETSGTGGSASQSQRMHGAGYVEAIVRQVGRVGVFFCFCGLSFVICNYFVSLSLEIYNSKIDNY